MSHIPQQAPSSVTAAATLGKPLNRTMSHQECPLRSHVDSAAVWASKMDVVPCAPFLTQLGSKSKCLMWGQESLNHKAIVAHCIAFLHRNVTGFLPGGKGELALPPTPRCVRWPPGPWLAQERFQERIRVRIKQVLFRYRKRARAQVPLGKKGKAHVQVDVVPLECQLLSVVSPWHFMCVQGWALSQALWRWNLTPPSYWEEALGFLPFTVSLHSVLEVGNLWEDVHSYSLTPLVGIFP